LNLLRAINVNATQKGNGVETIGRAERHCLHDKAPKPDATLLVAGEHGIRKRTDYSEYA
jgi:hypothetical protein